MPRVTQNNKLAMERLAEYLDLPLKSSGGGNYYITFPFDDAPLKRGVWKSLAILTQYAIELGMSDKEIREAINYRIPTADMNPTGQKFSGFVYELADEVGDFDARQLVRVYTPEE